MHVLEAVRLLRSPDVSIETRQRFNLLVRDSLQPVSIGLAVLYAFFAATHIAILPQPISGMLMAVATGIAIGYFLLSIVLRTTPVRPERAHPLAVVIIGLALAHAFLQLYLLADPLYTTSVALIILGAALLLISVRWLAAVIVVSLTGWVAIAWHSGPAPGWLHFAFVLSAVSAMALTINAVRSAMHHRLEVLRLQDELHTRQLEATTKVALESERRFRTVIQTAGSTIVVLGADYQILEFNAAAEALYGCRRHDVIGQHFRVLVPEGTPADTLIPYVDSVLEGATERGIESVVHTHGGRRRIVLWNLTRLLDGTEHVAGVVAIGQDITVRKRSEDAQRYLADMSRVLVSSLNDQALVQTIARLSVPAIADWCVVRLLATEAKDSDTVAVAHHDPVHEVLLRQLHQQQSIELPLIREVRRTGQTSIFPSCTDAVVDTMASDVQARRTLETVGCTSLVVAPLVARGEMHGVLMFAFADGTRSFSTDDRELIEDVATRIALAVDNARLYRNVQAALHARDDFLSAAAHELKTPLVALVGATQLVDKPGQRGTMSAEQTQRQMYVISKATQRLHKLIDSLIELMHIQAGRSHLRRQRLDLCKLAQRVVEAVQPAPRHRLQLEAPATPVIVEADDARLELALYNLVQNAIKYSPKGGAVTLRFGHDDANVWISVSDEGIGIPQASQARLFERFYRATNVNPEQIGGMGIGLHLVHEIVRQHGGAVEVDSTEGKGSTFTIRLPHGEQIVNSRNHTQ